MADNSKDHHKTNDELRAELAELRQQLEALRRGDEENLAAVIRDSGDGILVVDGQGIVLLANPAAERILRRTKDNIIGTQLGLPTSGSERVEIEMVTPDNEVVPVELWANETVWEGVPAVRMSIRDISPTRAAEQALRESEEILRYIIKHDPNALAVFDNDLHYMAVSDCYLQDYNVQGSEIIGKHHYEVFPEIPQRWRDVHQRVLQGAVEKNEDDYVIRKDGSTTYNRWECRPWYTAKGEIGGMITYAEVTTERKLAELQLKKSEEKYRRLTENSPDAIFRMLLPEGVYEYISPAAETIFGYPPDAWYDNPIVIKEIIHSDSASYFEEQWQRMLEGDQLSTFEYKIIHADKSTRWIYQRNVFVKNVAGQLEAIEGIVTDITKLKRAEAELIEQQKLFLTMFNTIPDGVMIGRPNREIILANNRMETLFGYTVEELAGNSAAMLYADQENFSVTGAAIFSKDVPVQHDWYQTNYRTKDGREFPGETFGAKLYDTDNRWIGNLAIIRDVTEVEKREQEREQLQLQLLQAQKMESLGTMAGGIAHDFNNILTAILGFTELAKGQAERGSGIDSDLQEIYLAGIRAKDLVAQILAFARQSGEEQKPIEVALIVKEVIKFLRSSAPTSIDIKQSINSNSLIIGNPTRLHQIIMNLATNAIQAIKDEQGILEVSLQDIDISTPDKTRGVGVGSYIELKISDNGAGIAPEHIKQIFEPYFTTKSQREGTGLGLSVVHGIIETYGGKISVDSTLDVGTTFTVYLPIASNRNVEISLESVVSPLGSERILIVDDEAVIVKMTARVLESLGYTVSTRTSSLEALELFRLKADHFDLVITDMTMPNMAGDRLVEEMRAIRPNIPVILCTGFSNRITKEAARERGINGFAFKPIVKTDFAKLVRKVLDEAKDYIQ